MTRVLVIDDDDQVRSFLRRVLERAGFAVVDAADGEAGTRMYREHPADLIITDIFMPGQDGLETILQLRHEFAAVKVIAVSGGDRTGEMDLRKEAILLGAARTLRKPFTPAELLASVNLVLAQPGAHNKSHDPLAGNAAGGPSGGG